MYQTFIQLYQNAKGKPTPCEEFVNEVAQLTGRSVSTVKKWGIGFAVPEINVRVMLSKHFKIPVNELFPAAKSTSHEK